MAGWIQAIASIIGTLTLVVATFLGYRKIRQYGSQSEQFQVINSIQALLAADGNAEHRKWLGDNTGKLGALKPGDPGF